MGELSRTVIDYSLLSRNRIGIQDRREIYLFIAYDETRSLYNSYSGNWQVGYSGYLVEIRSLHHTHSGKDLHRM